MMILFVWILKVNWDGDPAYCRQAQFSLRLRLYTLIETKTESSEIESRVAHLCYHSHCPLPSICPLLLGVALQNGLLSEWGPNKTGLQGIFVTFCAQRSLNLLHSGLWCSRTEGGHFNGGWIILPAKTSCCSKVIALRSTLASVSGQCTPEVDILSDQFASSKQDRAIFQPRNRMFSQDPLSFFFQLDN